MLTEYFSGVSSYFTSERISNLSCAYECLTFATGILGSSFMGE